MKLSQRAQAWRNCLVAGVNAATEHGLFSLTTEADGSWGAIKTSRPAKFHLGPFLSSAMVFDAGFGEIGVCVAVCPSGRFGDCVNGGFEAGAGFAVGWLQRERGAFLQTSDGQISGSFVCRAWLKPALVAYRVEPRGFSIGQPPARPPIVKRRDVSRSIRPRG